MAKRKSQKSRAKKFSGAPSLSGFIPPVFGSPWYTVGLAAAAWYLLKAMPKGGWVTSTVAVGQANAQGVVGTAPPGIVQTIPGAGSVTSNSDTNSNPYAVVDMVAKADEAAAENEAMTQGILRQPGNTGIVRPMGGTRYNPYLVQ